MNQALSSDALPRQPLQRRAKERFERVLAEAEVLLLEHGLGGFSIPLLAERLGSPRATLYKFFPTPYAIFNELLRRYLAKFEDSLGREAAPVVMRGVPWREATQVLVTHAAAFHNANPVARLLILGGPVSDESYRAQEITIQHLGGLTRRLFATVGIALPHEPDVATLAIDIGTTCFRHSVFLHGEITPAYREEAAYAMVAYLSRYADA
ncbi:MAG TPA: TetR/AcrR family transcriptional regulator [Nevskia sp.]|jgi:AcrR family transcriptional regulator|nr:TetR/AcrR family transcriptional regulator [Nevskia sp.]